MRELFRAMLAALALLLAVPSLAAVPQATVAAPAPVADLVCEVDIKWDSFTLPNGLRVYVHTDRKAPIVAVSVWYHIGSKDEPAGKTGFAHLFEHLMFYGSEHNDDVFFKKLEEVGATDANGTTWFDRTNYFQNVPTPALDLALFLESDRMGHLLGAVTQKKLDAQRAVVQNEKRQGDNEPYGLTEYAILEGLFPDGHPYRHSTIGSMADLDAASLADVHNWFKANYGPNNAVLVLAGDIDVATAKPLVTRYFGWIPPGPDPVRFAAPVPKRTATTRETMYDAVATTRISRIYVVPGRTDPVTPLVDVAATILAGGPTSRLYTDLVREKQLAVAVSGSVQPFEKVSLAQFDVDVKPGVDPAAVEARIDAIWAQFLKDGPTADEVQRVATRTVAGTIRGLEAVGGFGGKATALAEGAVYAGDPNFYKVELARYAAATPATVAAAAREWLGQGAFILTVLPGERSPRDVAKAAETGDAPKAASAPPERKQVAGLTPDIDRSKLPSVAGTPELNFPVPERATLANGMKVTLARRTTVPVVQVALSFDAGNAADSRAEPGTQSLMLGLLDEGTATRTGPQIAQERERLGAIIAASSDPDRSRVTLNALRPNLAASLALLADVVRNPAFPANEVERVRGQALAGIAQELSDPSSIARRTLPVLIYGPQSPYGVPGTGSGTAAGVKAASIDDLRAFHAAWIRPDNGEIFVVGDISMAELKPLLDAALGDWKAPATPKGVKTRFMASPPASARIVLIDRPDSPQSYIRGATVLPIKGTDDPLTLRAANEGLGGSSTSRLFTELREVKGWSYGAYSGVTSAAEQLAFVMIAPVQTDRTGDSIAAMTAQVAAIHGPKPLDEAERDRIVNNAVRSLPGEFESNSALLGAIERNALLGRPDDYYPRLPARYRALTTAELNKAALELTANRTTWVVVGDRKAVEPQLKSLGLPVEVRASE